MNDNSNKDVAILDYDSLDEHLGDIEECLVIISSGVRSSWS